MSAPNWPYNAGDRLVDVAEQIGNGIAGLPSAIKEVAKSLDNLAKAYAQANPSEDRR